MGSIGEFLQSNRGKKINGVAYGLGASVVIIGALFKILHLPGAAVMLTLGMGCEAILFALSALEPPHQEYDWSLVYPILGFGHGKDHKQEGKGNAVAGLSNMGSLSEEDIQKLSQGIKKLGDTAGKIADLSISADVSTNYVKNITAASEAAGSYAANQKELNESSGYLVSAYKNISENLGNATDNTKNFSMQIENINKNLSSIHSLYEVQLQSLSSQGDSFKGINNEFSKIQESLSGVIRESENYKEEASKLVEKVSELNAVYGKMLNAMKQ